MTADFMAISARAGIPAQGTGPTAPAIAKRDAGRILFTRGAAPLQAEVVNFGVDRPRGPVANSLDRTCRSGYPHPPQQLLRPSVLARTRMNTMDAPFRLALHQLPANPNESDALPRVDRAIREAARDGAQICVLPELFAAPYFCQEMAPRHFDRAETVPGPTTERLGRLAAELGVVIVASLFERAMTGLHFNTTAVLDADGALLGTYRKAHIPDDPLYCEKFYFAPGDSGFPVFKTRFVTLGVLICWDQWFPEAARLCALKGAELLLYPTAIGRIADESPAEHARQLDAWRTVQRGHAIANGVYLAAVNRVGTEAGIDFWGHSFCCGPQGELLAEADDLTPTTLLVDCEPGRVADVRNMWPFFRDRRVDAYAGLGERYLPGRGGTVKP